MAEVHNKAVHDGEMGPFNFPFSRGKVVKHTLTQGSLEYTFKLPDKIQTPTIAVLGFVKETVSSGTKIENPYNFQHYNLQDIVLKFDDQSFHVQTNFTTGSIVRAYNQLFVETGLQANGIHCGLSLEEFKDGNSYTGPVAL